MFEIYCDGSCPKQHGVGGWAFAMLLDDEQVFGSGFEPIATNNTMELLAILMALRKIKALDLRGEKFRIISDSQYAINGMREWRHRWITFEFEGIKNADIWRRMHAHVAKREENYEWQWVKGHAGNYWNEYVDRMAGKAQRAGLIQMQQSLRMKRVDHGTAANSD